MRATAATVCVYLSLLGLGACEIMPDSGIATPAEVKDLELLDPWFVRFDGERMPIDEFLLRMRHHGRRAATTGTPWFGIRITGPTDQPVDQKLIDRIIDDLRLSGVTLVRMG